MPHRILRAFNFGAARMHLPSDDVQFGQNARHLRMDTLVKLRWFGVAGQIVTILATAFVLEFSFDLVSCLALVCVLGIVNLLATVLAPRHLRLTEISATYFLIFDVLQLSAVLYLTGGIENPFAILILAPVTISAVSLRIHHIISVVLGLRGLRQFAVPGPQAAALARRREHFAPPALSGWLVGGDHCVLSFHFRLRLPGGE